MGSDVDVLVVGAGPAGLLLAGDLSRGRSALHRRGTARRGIPADSRIRRSRPNDGATGRPRPCRRPADDRPPQPDPAIPADRSVAPADPLPPRAREMRFPPRLKPGIPTRSGMAWPCGHGRLVSADRQAVGGAVRLRARRRATAPGRCRVSGGRRRVVLHGSVEVESGTRVFRAMPGGQPAPRAGGPRRPRPTARPTPPSPASYVCTMWRD